MTESSKKIAEHFVQNISDLVSLPDVGMRVYDMLDDPYFSAVNIGQLVGLDPGLSARLLRIVNSAYYGLQAQVDSIPHAITVIGADDLRSLILSTMTVSAFKNIPIEIIDMHRFWRHSLATAVIAKLLARECLYKRPERAFSWGMLHDIGELVLLHQAPEPVGRALETYAASGGNYFEIQQEEIGCNHAEVGAALLRHWSLPDSVWVPIQHHLDPDYPTEFRLESALLHIANAIASKCSPARQVAAEDQLLQVRESAWELTKLSPHIVDPIIDESSDLFDDLTRLLTG